MKIRFWKIAATGNDFVLIDAKNFPFSATKEQIARICSRRTGIGADGIIFMNESEGCDYKMRYLNADGGEVDMCGNGTRALAYFHKAMTNSSENQFKFETANGVYESHIDQDYVRIKMTELYDADAISVQDLVLGNDFTFYLNTGVPHTVFQVSELDNFDVVEHGRKVRYDERFENGVNANFFEKKGDRLAIRTYERGVEDETLSCGTGITAVALALYLNGDQRSQYVFDTRGGEVIIEVNSKDDVYLCGKVQKIYEGEFNSESFT